jgi:hypothetical protein
MIINIKLIINDFVPNENVCYKEHISYMQGASDIMTKNNNFECELTIRIVYCNKVYD